VLVVDSDRLTRWSICRYVERACPVAAVASAAQARRHLQVRPAAIVIGDTLPDGNPDRIIDEARVRYPGLRIVKLTSGLSAEDARRDKPSSVAVLEKPFSLEELGRLLGIDRPATPPLGKSTVELPAESPH